MPHKQADVEHGLKNKGFLVADSHHHYFIYYSLEGKKTTVMIQSKISCVKQSTYKKRKS